MRGGVLNYSTTVFFSPLFGFDILDSIRLDSTFFIAHRNAL